MLYYIYYGYVAGFTAYKLYEYWELANTIYNTCNYTYTVVNGVYKWVKTPESIDSSCDNDSNDEWEII